MATPCRGGGIGLHDVLKRHWASARAGSSPAPGTFSLSGKACRPAEQALDREREKSRRTAQFLTSPPILLAPMKIEQSMNQLNGRLSKAKEELRIVEEQLLFQMDVLEEAKTRMLVSETPLADSDYRIARDDYERLERQRARAIELIGELEKEQDRLLDRMLNA